MAGTNSEPSQQLQTAEAQAQARSRASRQPIEARRATQATASRLANLRNLAQKHLVEIDKMARQEEMEEKKRMADLELEARRRERRIGKEAILRLFDSDGVKRETEVERVAGQGERGEESVEKKGKLRTAQDVLDRLRWDPSFRTSEYRIGYLDRFGGVKEMNVTEWMRVREVTDEEFIPMHRIRWFKRVRAENGGGVDLHGQGMDGDEVVWHRDERIDRIFGST